MKQEERDIENKFPVKNMWQFRNLTLSLALLIGCFVSTGCSILGTREIQGMVYIPAGEFILGSNETDEMSMAKEFGSRHGSYFENEKPKRTLSLKGFYINTFEITNLEYQIFVEQDRYRPPEHWKDTTFEIGQGSHPAKFITWNDATAYCRWMGRRLPTEEEWEKAARGPKGNQYPWGNLYDETKGNLNKGHTVPVGSMKEDKSYYEVFDMGGNVMEWTASWYKPYPGSTYQSKDFGKTNKVLKGGYGSTSGHYSMGNINARGAFRNFFKPDGKGFDVGFRCAKDE